MSRPTQETVWVRIDGVIRVMSYRRAAIVCGAFAGVGDLWGHVGHGVGFWHHVLSPPVTAMAVYSAVWWFLSLEVREATDTTGESDAE